MADIQGTNTEGPFRAVLERFVENMELTSREKVVLIVKHRENVLKEAQRVNSVLEVLEQ